MSIILLTTAAAVSLCPSLYLFVEVRTGPQPRDWSQTGAAFGGTPSFRSSRESGGSCTDCTTLVHTPRPSRSSPLVHSSCCCGGCRTRRCNIAPTARACKQINILIIRNYLVISHVVAEKKYNIQGWVLNKQPWFGTCLM